MEFLFNGMSGFTQDDDGAFLGPGVAWRAGRESGKSGVSGGIAVF